MSSLLMEAQVVEGVSNFLVQKGRTEHKKVLFLADTERHQHGVDLHIKLSNALGRGNNYFIEAKGNARSDGTAMHSTLNTNVRWAISQIILRMTVDSRNNNYIYGIAVPDAEIEKCKAMIRHNWALRELKLRLYGAYRREDGDLFAHEYTPRAIYEGRPRNSFRYKEIV